MEYLRLLEAYVKEKAEIMTHNYTKKLKQYFMYKSEGYEEA